MSSLNDPKDIITFNAQVARGLIKPLEGSNRRWFVQAVHNEKKSEEAGRAIYDQVEMIEISFPGSTDRMTKPVNDGLREAYKEEYEAFKKGLDIPTDGTPIETFAMLPINVVKELKYLGVNTIEQLANASESVRKRLGTAQKWIAEAKSYLDTADKDATKKLRAEIKKLKTELASLAGKNKDLELKLKELSTDK